MRVLQLGPYPPPYGGVQTNLVAIRSFLLKRGIPCAVVNVTRHRKPDADNVYYPSTAGGVLKLLATLDYDIVHYHFGGILTRRVLALAIASTLRPGVKSVMTFHSGGFPSTSKGRGLGPNSIAACVLRRFDGLIAVNEEIMGFFEKLQTPSHRTRLISPYSFTRDETASLPPPIARFFETHSPVMISAGQLEPEYDLALQIEALSKIRSKFPTAGLLLAGSGSIESELRQRGASLHLEDHVLFAGDVPHGAAIQAIERADVMLRTTSYDGDSISVREALQVGAPVITSDNAMRPAAVTLVPKAELSALVRAIEAQFAQPRKPCAAEQKDESNLQAVFDFYQELLAGRE